MDKKTTSKRGWNLYEVELTVKFTAKVQVPADSPEQAKEAAEQRANFMMMQSPYQGVNPFVNVNFDQLPFEVNGSHVQRKNMTATMEQRVKSTFDLDSKPVGELFTNTND